MASESVADYLRTVYLLSEVGVKTFFWAFSKEFSDKSSSETFFEYIMRSKPRWNEALFKKTFDNTSIPKLKGDPTCLTFDISLQCAIFHKVTDKVSSSTSKDIQALKDKMRELKNLRNTVLHGTICSPMQEHIQNCREKVFELIDCISQTYDVSDEEKEDFLRKTTEEMEKVQRTPLTIDQLIQCSESYFKELACSGIQELILVYEKWSKINPVFFLGGWDFELKVDAVFSDIIVTDTGNRRKIGDLVNCKDILGATDKNLVLVEGQAGAGKSTLLKYILSKWATGDNEAMRRLTDFNILIFFECRNSLVTSLEDLLSFLLPTVSKKFHYADLLKCIMDLEVLFLVDGLDEVNEVSMKVVRQIMYAANKPNVTVLFTSRPTHVEKFYQLRPTSRTRHIRLDGIPSRLKGDFVERLHRNLCTVDESVENADASVEELVDYIQNLPSSLQAHFKFPLNLTLVTILWIYWPGEIHKVSSMTTLYTQILALVNEKLCERLLLYKECEIVCSRELKKSVAIVYDAICKKSFLDLRDNRYILEKNFLQQLRELCCQIHCLGKKIHLPAEEIFGAYLAVKHTWTAVSCDLQYMYPHRSFQEHMGASYFCSNIIERMLQREKEAMSLLKLSDKEEELEDLLDSSSLDEGSQDFLLHLMGMMHSKGPAILHDYGLHIIQYVSKRIDRWNVQLKWWLTLLREVQTDSKLVEMTATHISYSKWFLFNNDIDLSNMILPYTLPSHVDVQAMNLVSQESLMTFASFCSKISSAVIYLNYGYMNPSQGNQDDFFETILKSGTKLQGFTGHLSKPVLMNSLPNTLVTLEIAVLSEHAYVALMKWPHLEKLRVFGIHIDAKLPVEILVPLPHKPTKYLHLSGVTDETLHWAVSAALLLQSSEYCSIYCHGVQRYSEYTGKVKIEDRVTDRGWLQMRTHLVEATRGQFPLDPKVTPPKKILLNTKQWTVVPPNSTVKTFETIPRLRGLKTTKLHYS